MRLILANNQLIIIFHFYYPPFCKRHRWGYEARLPPFYPSAFILCYALPIGCWHTTEPGGVVGLYSGKSVRSIITYILDHPSEPFDVSPFVDKRCKTPVSDIQAAVVGAISPEQAVKLRQCLAHIDELEAHRKEIEQQILLIAEPYSAILDFLYTLPGLDRNPTTAIVILSEIGSDMSVFPSSKRLVSLSDCCPHNDQSNGKVKSTRISHTGCYFKNSSCPACQCTHQFQKAS